RTAPHRHSLGACFILIAPPGRVCDRPPLAALYRDRGVQQRRCKGCGKILCACCGQSSPRPIRAGALQGSLDRRRMRMSDAAELQAEQVAYWNGPGGANGVAQQKRTAQVMAGSAARALARADAKPGE